MTATRPSRRLAIIWTSLILLRLLVALTSRSAIHPDEHFQNPEVAASFVFDYDTRWGGGPLRTWEWEPDLPSRSVGPVGLTMGVAFSVVKLLGGPTPSGRTLLLAQRSFMWLSSLVVDYVVWQLSHSPIALLLFASSPVTFTFLSRPFSNSLETVLSALALLLAEQARARKLAATPMTLLGVVLAAGVFTRVTFVAFAAPLVIGIALTASRDLSYLPRRRWLPRLLKLAFPTLASFSMTSLLFILIDTLYFRGTIFHFTGKVSLILTPLNLLRYNLSRANLASHGIHPRYLHVVANWPMLFGVGLWASTDAVMRCSGDQWTRRLYLACFVVPTLLLSIQPHQEPRFLLPLVVPLVLLASRASFMSGSTGRRKRRAFWTIWILHSFLFTALFGYLHQAGLVPSLLALNDSLRSPGMPFLSLPPTTASPPAEIELVFWKTFMPPRHLVLPLTTNPTSQTIIHISDISSSTLPTNLADVLLHRRSKGRTVLLIAPGYAMREKIKGDLPNLKMLYEGKQWGVNVDMDRVLDVLDGWWDGDGVGMGVWRVLSKEEEREAEEMD